MNNYAIVKDFQEFLECENADCNECEMMINGECKIYGDDLKKPWKCFYYLRCMLEHCIKDIQK